MEKVLDKLDKAIAKFPRSETQKPKQEHDYYAKPKKRGEGEKPEKDPLQAVQASMDATRDRLTELLEDLGTETDQKNENTDKSSREKKE